MHVPWILVVYTLLPCRQVCLLRSDNKRDIPQVSKGSPNHVTCQQPHVSAGLKTAVLLSLYRAVAKKASSLINLIHSVTAIVNQLIDSISFSRTICRQSITSWKMSPQRPRKSASVIPRHWNRRSTNTRNSLLVCRSHFRIIIL